ncbi:MAG: type VI secretion system baseplate subunit TssE [Rhodothermales bacterium]
MKAGLYDVLRGRFYDATPVHTVAESGQRLQSVLSNLNRLFNTRQGSIDHLPDYGLPEVSSVYFNAPYSIDGLRQAVKEIVQKYEPRLSKVYVEQQHADDQEMRLTFLITAELERGQRVKFKTTFASDNLVQVDRWTRPE